MSISREAGALSPERELLRLEGLDDEGFASALTGLLGADHLLLFAPGPRGGVRELVLSTPLPREIRVRLSEAGELAGAHAPLSGMEDDAILIEDRARIPFAEIFPEADWSVAAAGPAGSFTAVLLGRGRARPGILADPLLKTTLLRRLSDRVSGRRAGLQEASDALARISHEFKTPLVSIKGYAELILDRCGHELGPEHREWVRRIAGAANRLAGVFRRATLEARSEGTWAFEPRPVDPGEWIQWCVAEARALAQARDLEWSWEVAEGTGPARVDPEAGRDLLLELLQNAARATPDGGSIRVTATAAQGRDGRAGTRLSVEDTGVGVPSGPAGEAIFEPFSTLSQAKGHHSGDFEFGAGGLGLGLSLVRRIVKAHGGEVWAEARARGRDRESLPGCTVHVWFPSGAEAAGALGEVSEPFAGRVLVVDADPEARRVLGEALADSCEVVAVGDRAEALEKWEREEWQGCILEPHLPGGGSGVDFIRELRARAEDPSILVYTTRVAPGEAEAWRAAGADSWLSKPARARLLIQRLQALRKRRSRR